jgi:hydroxyacylglutathione hydrolase
MTTMLFETFEEKSLAQLSYAVGCPAAGEMAVVDPRRDVDVYLDFAAAHGLRISHVLETHIHADYASGARELAERTGAELWLSAYDRGETFEVSFPHREARDGDEMEIGSVKIRAVHTPGHTPEHLSFLVYDGSRSREVPLLMLTGDFLFVGSLGRPDLLGEEAKQELAGRLYDSARGKLAGLPDGLEIHPAHGAGSLCGAGMSGRSVSTLGYERATNPYLDPTLSRQAFIDRILGSVPPGEDVRVVDVRGPGEWHQGHIPGAVHLPLPELALRSGELNGEPLALVCGSGYRSTVAASVLERSGFRRLHNVIGGMRAWRGAGLSTEEAR